jgi:hypothetical protein
MMNNQAPSMLKSALISGAAFGVAGAIPVVNWINCACCALIIGCGFFAAFLYSKDCRSAGISFQPSNGATVGLVSGLVYGAVSGVLGGIISSVFGLGNWEEVIDQIQASGADIPPETLDQISSFMESSGSLMMVLIGIFFALLFGAIFGTIGGLIGGSVFKHQPQASAHDQAPPPPPIG